MESLSQVSRKVHKKPLALCSKGYLYNLAKYKQFPILRVKCPVIIEFLVKKAKEKKPDDEFYNKEIVNIDVEQRFAHSIIAICQKGCQNFVSEKFSSEYNSDEDITTFHYDLSDIETTM